MIFFKFSILFNQKQHDFFRNNHQQSNKPVRALHNSSTRHKITRLFSNGSDIESTSARTLTPEHSIESGVSFSIRT